MKKSYLIIGVIIILIITGFYIYYKLTKDNEGFNTPPPPPTGQRDSYNCWLPSGEHWCANQNKCLENTIKCNVTSNIAKTVIVKLGQEVVIEPGLSIVPERVKEDSRCNDICSSPGTVVLSISTYGTNFPVNRGATIPITLGVPFIIEGYKVTLTKVLPGVRQDRPLLPEEYSFEFTII